MRRRRALSREMVQVQGAGDLSLDADLTTGQPGI
jgi:hypothetical protein